MIYNPTKTTFCQTQDNKKCFNSSISDAIDLNLRYDWFKIKILCKRVRIKQNDKAKEYVNEKCE